MIVRIQDGIEIVEEAVDREEMTAELYVILLAQGRIHQGRTVVFGTAGYGAGVVMYRLIPTERGTVDMVRMP